MMYLYVLRSHHGLVACGAGKKLWATHTLLGCWVEIICFRTHYMRSLLAIVDEWGVY